MFGLPVIVWKLRTGVSWHFFGRGVAALVVGTVPYMAMMLLVFAAVYLTGRFAGSGGGFGLGVPEIAFLTVPTFAMAVFLPLAVLLAFVAARPMCRASWKEAVAFGIGWAAPSSAAGWVRAVYPVDLVTKSMSLGLVAVRAGTVLLLILGVLGGTLVAVLMVYTVRRDDVRWFRASIAFDIVSWLGASSVWAAAMNILGLALNSEPWSDLVRAVAYAPFALFGLWSLRMLRNRWPGAPADLDEAGPHGSPAELV